MGRLTPIDRYRNIGVVAHVDAGKTTITERMLYCSGLNQNPGDAEQAGLAERAEPELDRGITITAAATTCLWNGHKINIVETPGHADFTIEVERSLRVLDGAVAVFCGVRGVEPQVESVWRQATKRGMPRIAYINKMDLPEANFWDVVATIRQRLGVCAIPVQVPMVRGEEFVGVVDLVRGLAQTWDQSGPDGRSRTTQVPGEYQPEAEDARRAMLEALGGVDEGFFDRLSAGGACAEGEIREALRRATLSLRAVPILCGAAFRNRGIQPLLDATVYYLPSPADLRPAEGCDVQRGGKAVRNPDDTEPFSALAFKVITDPYVGQVTFLRAYSGSIQAGGYVYNPRTRKKERVGRVLEVHATERREVEGIYAGDIVAAAGLKNAVTGDTLCDPVHPIILGAMDLPPAVIAVAIAPKTPMAKEKLAVGLARIAAEDPTVDIRTDEEGGRSIVSGSGELQLEVIVDRLLREFNAEANVGKPEVAYRATIGDCAEAEGRFVRHGGSRGQYARVVIRLEPSDPSQRFAFRNGAPESAVPKEYVAAVERGVREAMNQGGADGYPITGIIATLVDGSSHEVDSSEMAFKLAAATAVRDGFRRASPRVLEPMMRVEVVAPVELLSEVLEDLGGRGAQIRSVEGTEGARTVHGIAPFSALLGYPADLKSKTQGRATHTMRFSHYQEVPPNLRLGVAGVG